LRIFPLYYFYLLLILGLTLLFPILKLNALKMELGARFENQFWAALLYVYDFMHASAWFERSRFFTHLWSLSVEEQFYLIWPLLIFVTPRERFKTMCLSAIGLGFVFRLAITLIYRAQAFPFLFNDPQQAVNVLPFSHVDAFALGAYISRFDLPRSKLQLAALALALPALGLFSDYMTKGAWSASLGYDLPLTGWYKEVWGYTVLNYFFALIVYGVARKGFFRFALEWRPLRYLGKISYGLYVYHYGMIAVVGAVFRKYDLDYGLRSPQYLVVALAATVLLASLSFRFMEKPLIDLKDRFFRT
jgi:peptidoglycan/LPS O-acetylase OafA/YrhL